MPRLPAAGASPPERSRLLVASAGPCAVDYCRTAPPSKPCGTRRAITCGARRGLATPGRMLADGVGWPGRAFRSYEASSRFLLLTCSRRTREIGTAASARRTHSSSATQRAFFMPPLTSPGPKLIAADRLCRGDESRLRVLSEYRWPVHRCVRLKLDRRARGVRGGGPDRLASPQACWRTMPFPSGSWRTASVAHGWRWGGPSNSTPLAVSAS